MEGFTMELILGYFIVVAVFGYFCSQIMGNKGQSKVLGFFMGFLVFFGVIAAILYPKNDKEFL